jgi:hypothetical protein
MGKGPPMRAFSYGATGFRAVPRPENAPGKREQQDGQTRSAATRRAALPARGAAFSRAPEPSEGAKQTSAPARPHRPAEEPRHPSAARAEEERSVCEGRRQGSSPRICTALPCHAPTYAPTPGRGARRRLQFCGFATWMASERPYWGQFGGHDPDPGCRSGGLTATGIHRGKSKPSIWLRTRCRPVTVGAVKVRSRDAPLRQAAAPRRPSAAGQVDDEPQGEEAHGAAASEGRTDHPRRHQSSNPGRTKLMWSGTRSWSASRSSQLAISMPMACSSRGRAWHQRARTPMQACSPKAATLALP